MQAFGAGHIEIRLVDGGHFHLRRKRAENFVNLLRKLAVAVRVPIDEDGMRTHLGSGAQRHGGVHSELSGGIRGCGDNSALVALPADDDGLAFQQGIVEFFDRHEESIHVDVEDGARNGELLRGSHAARILPAAFAMVRSAQSGALNSEPLLESAS